MSVADTLVPLIEQAFSPNGWLVSKGFRHLPEQQEYARHVATWLLGEETKPVGLLEGEPGTGKTLGYLIPLMLYSALTGRRVAVSTFTIALQNQILNGDLWIAESFLKEQGLPARTVRQRLGRQNFVDLHRVEDVYTWLQEAGLAAPEHDEFIAWARHSVVQGCGQFFEWLDQRLEFPGYFTPAEICLTPASKESANPAFLQHVEDSREADVLLTSHSMLIANLFSKGLVLQTLEGGSISAIVADEADRIQQAADLMLSKRLQPKFVASLARRLAKIRPARLRPLVGSLITDCDNLAAALKELAKSYPDQTALLISQARRAGSWDALVGPLTDLQTTAAAFLSEVQQSSLKTLSEQDRHVLDELKAACSWLAQFGEEQAFSGGEYGFGWSPKQRVPSLLYRLLNPGLSFSNYWRLMDTRVLLTSATLRPGGSAGEGKDAFVGTRNDYGIGKDRVCAAACLAPSHFGEAGFVLPDPQVPKPVRSGEFDEEDQVVYDSDWLKYAAAMIDTALAYGPTLVLARSFHQVHRLQDLLSRPIVAHRKGMPLGEAIDRLLEEQTGLISPAIWEGISIRAEGGGQLIKNVVVTLLPFEVPDQAHQDLFIGHYLKRHPTTSASFAESLYFQTVISRAVLRLRQGLGRGIRHMDDQVVIWIADPRFPRPSHWMVSGKNTFAMFRRAVPARFQTDLQAADVFALDSLTRRQPEIKSREYSLL